MVTALEYLTEGQRIFFSGLKSRILPRKYYGPADGICRGIVKDCWNGQFFQTSNANFKQFWTRDFGLSVQSLLELNYQKEVQQTLKYALNRFRRKNKITTTITPWGKPFDFPNEAVDSLPWLIHSIRLSDFPYYEYKDFLNLHIKLFFETFIDPKTGLVKHNKHFSSIKDFAIRKSSCYDNCMVGLLAENLSEMKWLNNPFDNFDYGYLVRRYFWNGKFFYDDLTRKHYVAGDANIFPFICGLFNNKDMLKSVITEIRQAQLDTPFPLKYTNSKEDNVKFIPQEFFLKNYESDSIWTHLGILYIKLVQSVSPELAQFYQQQYAQMIENNHNYLEVFFNNGTPYSSPFYYRDSGMLWAANYLTLK